MNKVAFVGSKRLGILLKNFGIEYFVAEKETIINEIKTLAKSNEYTVIFTEETFFDLVKNYLQEKTESLPVIMMLPTVMVKNRTLNLIGEVVKKAVGINILTKNEDRGE